MAVSQLTICEWRENTVQETIIENPTWRQIEKAIQALNNDNFNDLYLDTGRNSWLCVGGGAGSYLLTGAIDEQLFPTLVDITKTATAKYFLTVGGQTGEYSENWIHDLTQTLIAVRDFYETGGFSSAINWVTK